MMLASKSKEVQVQVIWNDIINFQNRNSFQERYQVISAHFAVSISMSW